MYKKIFTLFVATIIVLAASLLQVNAQTKDNKFVVEGKVINGATKLPLRGVRVTFKNLAATITDSAGQFSIKLPVTKALLYFSGDGLQAKEIAVKSKNKLNVVMNDDNFSSQSDLIILPNSITTKTQTPYTVSSINVTDGWNRYGESPDSYLQGKVTGLNSIRRSGTSNM